MKYIAKINAKYFAAVQIAAATVDVRYYLNGVQLERHPQGGVLMIATNGHRMHVMHDPEGWLEPESFLVGSIKPDLLAACKKSDKLTGQETALWLTEDGAVVSPYNDRNDPPGPFDERNLGISRIKRIDGKFPDWRKVAKAELPTEVTTFAAYNPVYVSDIGRAGKILAGGPRRARYQAMRILSAAEDTVGIVQLDTGSGAAGSGNHFIAFIMPVRSTMAKGLPSFVTTWTPPPAEPEPAVEQPAAPVTLKARKARKKSASSL